MKNFLVLRDKVSQICPESQKSQKDIQIKLEISLDFEVNKLKRNTIAASELQIENTFLVIKNWSTQSYMQHSVDLSDDFFVLQINPSWWIDVYWMYKQCSSFIHSTSFPKMVFSFSHSKQCFVTGPKKYERPEKYQW